MKREFCLRSMMFVPGHNEKLLDKASRSLADSLILDLEDSVQPYANKEIAREKIVKKVKEGAYKRHSIFPRINDRESGELLKDVTALTIPGIDGFVFPKAKTGKDIYFFDKLLETVEYEKGIEVGTFKIIPLIETSAAVLNAQDIIQASKRVVAIAYGCHDFLADLEGVYDNAGESIYVPRAIIAMAARANDVIPIDTVHIRVHDLEHLDANLKVAKNLGFEGMLVLTPKELPLVHQYFTPSEEEVKEAKEMLRLFELAQKEGKGVAIMNGTFIGPPMVISARKVIDRIRIIEKREGN